MNRQSHISHVLIVTILFYAASAACTLGEVAPTTQQTSESSQEAPPSPHASSIATSSTDLTNLSLEDLMNVQITTVSRQAQRVADAPAAVTVINQEDIARSGMTTIPDLLRLVPGMEVAKVDANKWAIGSRGLNDLWSNKLLVLVDGRSVYNPQSGGVLWDTVDYPLEDLDRIEVVRGPGATMWGSNAVNGIVNIQTKEANQTQGWLLSGLAGTEQQDVAVRYGGKIDGSTFFRVYTKARNFDDAALPSGRSANDHWNSVQGGFRLDHTAGSRDKFTVQGDIWGNDLNQTDNLVSFAPPFTHTVNNSYSHDGGNLLGRWTHEFSDTSSFTLQTYYDRLDNYDNIWREQQDTGDIDFQHSFALGKRQQIIWGAGYRFIAIRSVATPTLQFIPPDRDLQLINGFVQDDITLVPDHLHLILGIKLEDNSYTNLEVEPAGRILWTPTPQHSIWGSIARATRTPDQFLEDDRNLLAVFPTGPSSLGSVQLFGNHDLKSEELLAYEAGYRFEPSSRWSVDVSGFYNRYDNFIGFNQNPSFFTTKPAPHVVVSPYVWSNNMGAESYGGELAATWRVTERWKLIGSYSFEKLMAHRTTANAVSQPEQFAESSSPAQQLQIRSYLDLPYHLQLNTAAYYVSPIMTSAVPAYVRLDANIAWDPTEHLRVMAGVQNLLDDRHPEASTNAHSQGSETERMFFAQAAWQF